MTAAGATARPAARPSAWLRELRRAVRWHRRLLVAGLLAAAVAFGLQAVRPPPPATSAVVVAAHDLAAGVRLGDGDVRVARLLPGSVPDGVVLGLSSAVGRTLAAPLRRGAPLTDVALIGPSYLATYGAGVVAVPVRIADADSVRLVRAGDVVDVLAAGAAADGTAAGAARLVASEVPVVAIPPAERSPFGADDLGQGALVVVVTSSETAARLAAAAVTERLSIVLRGRDR